MEKWGLQKYNKSRSGKKNVGQVNVVSATKDPSVFFLNTPTRTPADSLPTPPNSRQSTPIGCLDINEFPDLIEYVPEALFVHDEPVIAGSTSGSPSQDEITALDIAKIMETKTVADFFYACRLYDDAFNFYTALHSLISANSVIDGFENIIIATAVGCSHSAKTISQTDEALEILGEIIFRDNMQSKFPLMIVLCWTLRVDLLTKRGDLEAAKCERNLILESDYSRTWFWDNLHMNSEEIHGHISMFPIQLQVFHSMNAGAFITTCDLTTVLPGGAASMNYLSLAYDPRSICSVLVRKDSSNSGIYIQFDAKFVHQTQHLALFNHLWSAWYAKTLNGRH
jgi:hypothetical protein